MMEIQLGSVYTNRTKKYLLPTLKEYGGNFETKFTNLFKLAIGVGDYSLKNMDIVMEHSIFILIDTKFSRKIFKDTMLWMKSQGYYKFDYAFDDIHSGHLHMLVIEVPERFKKTSEEFHKSNYSKMYEFVDLNNLFLKKEEELSVLTKSPEMLLKFIDKINSMYKTNVSHIGWKGEVDLPIDNTEEYFNTKLYKQL
jgi:hypothetical protein